MVMFMPEKFSHNNGKDNNDLAGARVRIGVGNQDQFATSANLQTNRNVIENEILCFSPKDVLRPFQEPTILDKIDRRFGPPLPPISMMPIWRVFAPLRLHHCFGGGGGIIVPL